MLPRETPTPSSYSLLPWMERPPGYFCLHLATDGAYCPSFLPI